MTRSGQRGFTLIELIIFIVVVSVGLVGILKVMDVTVASSADPMVRKQAMALADSILEEILGKAYCDPDPLVTTGETTRVTMDDVADFNGVNETIPAGPVFVGMPADLNGYNIAIEVPAAAVLLGAVPARRVTVTVRRGTEVIAMVGHRTRYGDDLICAP
jgi:MSHA pilin protein MshD